LKIKVFLINKKVFEKHIFLEKKQWENFEPFPKMSQAGMGEEFHPVLF